MSGQESRTFAPAVHPLRRHLWVPAVAGVVALLGMVTAYAIAPATDPASVPLHVVLEELAPPSLSPVLPGSAEFVREERIRRSDTIASLMNRLGVADREALTFILQNREAQAVSRQLRPGKTITAKTDESGKLITLFFPLNTKDTMLVVERATNGFLATEKALQMSTETHIQSGEIVSSLFEATDTAGIPDAIATQLAELFSGDIDFYRDLRKGDRFSVVYETIAYNGQHIRSGHILAAEFTNNNKTYKAFWFQTEEGREAYYTADGQSLRKAFLRSPLEFSRVTSGFSSSRFHPVLQTMRAHKGIDYAAPIGTRVRAIGDGVVEFAASQNGYGNLIVLKHRGPYSTAYAHLNGFAPNIRKGVRVSQGDTIGFVGQTGLATGPHVHYEFRVDGQQVNPASVALPVAIPLEPAQLAKFKSTTMALRDQIDMIKEISLASAAH